MSDELTSWPELGADGMEAFMSPLGRIRAFMDGGETWFVARDVCEALGLGNTSRALMELDEDEKTLHQNITSSNCLNDCKGLRKDTRLVNESGLYALIFRSRKPGARAFRKWVTGTLLPELRKRHMAGVAAQAELEQSRAEVARAAEELREAKEELREKEELAAWQGDYMAANQGRVEIGRRYERAHGAMSVAAASRELAQMVPEVPMGPRRLYNWLRGHGYVCKSRNPKSDRYCMPTFMAVKRGFMITDWRVCTVKSGPHKGMRVRYLVTMVTQAGVANIAQELRSGLLHYR